jgi:hypothetical protein
MRTRRTRRRQHDDGQGMALRVCDVLPEKYRLTP